MRSLVLFISLWLSCWVAADGATKEELRQQTEAIIRAEQERKSRLQKNEVLDNAAEIYYDGNNTYPGLVIDGTIYPAIVRNNYRYPACLVKGKLLLGKYDGRAKQIVCQLRSERVFFSTKTGLHKVHSTPATVSSSSSQPTPASSPTQLRRKSIEKVKNVHSQSGAIAEVMEVNAFKRSEKFGIRAGTWARIYLPRSVSSSEPADIEMELLEDVVGKYRTLPAGTIFFTRHRVNPATRRLDMEVILMVLPDGKESQVSATIHGSGKTAGLAGAILTHSNQIAQSAAGQSILAGTQEAIVGSVINNPFAAVAGDVAKEVVESKKQALPTAPRFSVQVSPQEALIRFRRSF